MLLVPGIPNLPLILNLTSFTIGRASKTPGAPTSSGYELRSKGPAVLGTGALDTELVSAYAVEKLSN
jgi:hypothetical protein